MKLKHRALALLLSLAIMLTFMPAMAFAAVPEGASTKKATELKYEGNLEYEVDEEGFAYFDGYYEAGNKITVSWDDGTKDVFLSKNARYTGNDGESWETTAYFPENAEPHWSLDEYGDYVTDNEVYFYSDVTPEGQITISYDYDYYNESEDYSTWDSISTTVQGVKPVSLSYDGPPAVYESWDGPIDSNPYQEGAKITVRYDDGSTRTMVCKGWVNEEDGETWTTYRYFWEDVEPIIVTDEDGYKEATNNVNLDFRDEEATTEGLPVEYKGARGMIPVMEKAYFKPVSFEFIQGEKGSVYAEVGQKHLYGLAGEGNIIRLTDADGNVRDYAYGEYDDDFWSFFYNDEEGNHSLWIYDVTLSKRVSKKGTSTVSGKVTFECDGGYEYTFPVNVKVSASKFYTEVKYKEYTYTGKKITPKIVVKYFNGKSMKTMPKSWYTTNAKKKSAIGEYNYKITLKKKYQKKYGKYLYGGFSIIPKKPTIKSATGGSGKVTVKWSKFSSSARKNINGFVVQIAKNSKFTKDDEYYWVEKKTASQYTISGLEPGKYYVRVVSYKDTKKYGSFWSKPSKVKSVTVK